MITIKLNATYDGMNPVEVFKEVVKPLQESGMSDDGINELLMKHEDKEEREHE